MANIKILHHSSLFFLTDPSTAACLLRVVFNLSPKLHREQRCKIIKVEGREYLSTDRFGDLCFASVPDLKARRCDPFKEQAWLGAKNAKSDFFLSLSLQLSPERWQRQKRRCKPKKGEAGQSLRAKLRSPLDFHHSRPTCPPDNIAVFSIILKVDDSPRGVLRGRLLVLAQTTPPVAQAPLK